MAPTRVLVVAPWARRLGGGEEMLWAFLRTAPRKELELAVVFFEDGPFEREVAALGLPTQVIPAGRLSSPWQVVRTTGALARAIRRLRPDVVLNWMAKTQLYGSPATALSRTGARVVWWQHLTPTGHWMDRLATLLPAGAVGASSAASAAAQRRLRPARRTFTVHPGVDVPPEPGPGPTREELGLSAEATIVVIVGRLQPWKGQLRAVEAVSALREEGLDVQLLVVGGTAFGFDEDYPAAIRRRVAELGLQEHVVLVGQVASAHPFLALADVALNASEHEPFGIVLLEAMADGVPVVAVDAGGPREIVVDGRDGRLARDGSPPALADALRPLVRDPSLRRRLGEAGRARYAEHFTAGVMSRRISAALREVAP